MIHNVTIAYMDPMGYKPTTYWGSPWKPLYLQGPEIAMTGT